MIPARAAAGTAEPRVVALAGIEPGEMLAEGGEGRVFELPRRPHLVYKSYRRWLSAATLGGLLGWLDALEPGPVGVVRAASAWPSSVVVDSVVADRAVADRALGILMPRAPRRFALRHRDGQSRLASLSYLTADPAQRAAAYGLTLPEPASPQRIGIVYALARLLAAFESREPVAGHGDLSTKNVLWSLQRGPEVYVLDCDSAELFSDRVTDVDRPLQAGRRRAMTPNWDDPAVARGSNPARSTDRYSLALIFLRLVGAANFPVQARQRAGGPVEVTFPVPTGRATTPALSDPHAPVWRLCSRGLAVADPESRPSPAEWAAVLGDLLESSGAATVAASVRAQQGGWEPDRVISAGAGEAGEVEIRPELVASVPRVAWSKVAPTPRWTGAAGSAGVTGAAGIGANGSGGLRWVSPAGGAAQRRPPPAHPGALATGGRTAAWPEVKAQLARGARAWSGAHAAAVRLLLAGAWARGAVRLVACAGIDLLGLVVLAGLVGVLAAPLLGL